MIFDILSFWKGSEIRYLEVATMARDILGIPISTVASESTFSIGGRVIDQYRSSLKPNVVEALVCTRDWLYGKQGNIRLLVICIFNFFIYLFVCLFLFFCFFFFILL